MPLHIMKLAVGAESAASIAAYQKRRLADARKAGKKHLWVRTRHRPKREEDVLDGGSLYWVIKGIMRVRQRIVGFDTVRDAEGVPECHILVDPALVAVLPTPRRPFQGWRYLEAADAPADLSAAGSADGDALPPELVVELRQLGLL
ncbi:MAG: DUF1489 domain-containing protein [Alphaproteobacteria bacterium]|nr:DUF1489 domain-containing protein [Alphaproteobacteria bacterium]